VFGPEIGKNRKISFFGYPLSIYHSTRLDVLIKNIYGFDMFGLNLNELLGVKVSKTCTFPKFRETLRLLNYS
jgi:hypothetical protein